MTRSHSLRAALAAAPALFVAATTLSSQSAAAQAPRPATAAELAHFDMSAGTVQDLALPTARIASSFSIDLADATVVVHLTPNDIRSPNFELLVDDGQSIQRIATPPSVTWRGRVEGYPGSTVAATVTADGIEATVWLGATLSTWGIQRLRDVDPAAPAARSFVFNSANSTLTGVQCGLDDKFFGPADPLSGQQTGAAQLDGIDFAEIAIDADFEYYQRFGSSTTGVSNQVTSILNGVGVIYARDVAIDYTLTSLIVRTATVYTTSDMQALIGQFRTQWNATQGGTQRDVAHLFTGKGSFSGIIGIASLGVICNIPSAYGVDKAYSNSQTTNIGLVAHELGHNWNAPHCASGSNDCRIMCAGLGGCANDLTRFGTASIGVISSFAASRSCLSPNPAGSTSTYGIGCSTQAPSQCASLNPSGGTLAGTTRNNEYAYTVPNNGPATVRSFDLYTQSTTGGNVTVNAAIYNGGGGPSGAPSGTTTITIGGTPGFYTATFNPPVAVDGTFWLGIDHSAETTLLSTLNGGQGGGGFWRRPPGAGNWASSGLIPTPSWRVTCQSTPTIGNTGTPTINTSFDITLTDGSSSVSAILAIGSSDSAWSGLTLPFSLDVLGGTGCSILASIDAQRNVTTSASGSATSTISVPNDSTLIGAGFFSQWLLLDPAANALGLATSNGLRMLIGG